MYTNMMNYIIKNYKKLQNMFSIFAKPDGMKKLVPCPCNRHTEGW